MKKTSGNEGKFEQRPDRNVESMAPVTGEQKDSLLQLIGDHEKQ